MRLFALACALSPAIVTCFAYLPHAPRSLSVKRGRTGALSAIDVDSGLPVQIPPGAEAVCVEDGDTISCAVEPCPPEVGCKTALNVRIDDTWYDLAGWRKAHPGGSHWIDYYDGRDATEVMYGFHSPKAIKMFSRLPKSKSIPADAPEATNTMLNFRKLREQLEEDGWMERDYKHESILLGYWGLSYAVGVSLVNVPFGPAQVAGMVALAVANTQTGWLGHDYIHGVDKFSETFRNFAALFAGMSPTWWSDKHNKHHALTNEAGVDEDIATDPFLFCWAPPEEKDNKFMRQAQPYLLPVWFSVLFWYWRIDSIKLAWENFRTPQEPKRRREQINTETALLAAHWIGAALLVPWHIIPQYVFLSGFITAVIVTVTHQSEEIFDEYQPDFVDAQYRSTCNAKTRTAFSEWLWGGMQYQLEHHLFPNMPRSRYPALVPILEKFAEDNNIEGGYRVMDEFDLIKVNVDMYRRVANEQANPAAPLSSGGSQQAAIP